MEILEEVLELQRVNRLAATLSSGLVCLRQVSEDDAEAILGAASHEEVLKTVAWEPHRTLEEFRRQIRLSRNLGWASRHVANGQALGTVGLIELSPICAEVTFKFHQERWNSRPPLVNLQLVLDWAFTRFPMVTRIQARCFPTSVSSCHLLDTLGMRFEGVNRAMVKIRDDVFDLSSYAMTRQDWARKSGQENRWPIVDCDFVHI